MNLSEQAVNKPISVLMVFAAVLIIGAISLLRLPVELMPNISQKKITIITRVRGGMPPSEVEELVTRPIEDAVSMVSGIEEIISRSEKAESQVVMRFQTGTDMDFAALEVREKFAKIKNKLPREIERPVIARYEESDQYVLIAAVTSKKYTTEYLRRITDDNIKEYLLRVNGVANVDVYGGRERKIMVEFDQDKLNAMSLPILKVIDMLGLNNLNLLAGDVEGARNRYMLRTIGEFKTVDEISEIPVSKSPSGSLVRLKDIAKVEDSYIEAENYARLGIVPEKLPTDIVSLYVNKESTANTIEVVKGVKRQIDGPIRERLAKAGLILDNDLRIEVIRDQAGFIQEAINNVKWALIYGTLLTTLVLYGILRDRKSTFVIFMSIPISVVVTFAFMYMRNLVMPQNPLSINVMTLSGLALGIGMLVDNSIVVLENIFSKQEKGVNPRYSAITGAKEVFIAIVASTLTTVIVFLPIVFVTEEIKMLYGGLAMTVTFSLLSSLFVAVTLIPAFSARFLHVVNKGVDLSGVKKRYSKYLREAIRKRYFFTILAFFVLMIAMVLSKTLDREFMGQTEQSKFTVFVRLEAGAKLEASDEIVKEVEKALSLHPAVENFSSRTEGWSSRIYVSLFPFSKSGHKTEQVIEYLRPKLKEIERKYRGGFIYFSEIQAPGLPEISVDVYGHNYEKLDELIKVVGQGLQAVPGMVDLKRSIEPGRPEYNVIVDKERAAYYGFTAKDVADIVHAEMRGLRATLFHTESKEVETVARLEEEHRRTFSDIKNLVVTTPRGDSVYLGQLAKFEPSIGPSEIHRRNKNRYIELSGTSTILSESKAIKKIKTALKDVKLPRDYFWEFGRDYEKQVQSQRQLMFVLFLAFILVYMILAALYESYYQPFVIMLTIPLAAIGVIFTLLLTQRPIGTGVLMGSVMLAGIVVNNAIILVDHINQLRRGGASAVKAVLAAGKDRLRPIFLTTGTTIITLVPMALDRSEASNLWAPLAITVMGGLTFGTILTLILVPSIYIIFEDIQRSFRQKSLSADAAALAAALKDDIQLAFDKVKYLIRKK